MMAPEGLLAEVLRIDSSIPHSRHFSFQRLHVCMGGGGGGHEYTRNMYSHNCLACMPRPHVQPGHVLTSMIDL